MRTCSPGSGERCCLHGRPVDRLDGRCRALCRALCPSCIPQLLHVLAAPGPGTRAKHTSTVQSTNTGHRCPCRCRDQPAGKPCCASKLVSICLQCPKSGDRHRKDCGMPNFQPCRPHATWELDGSMQPVHTGSRVPKARLPAPPHRERTSKGGALAPCLRDPMMASKPGRSAGSSAQQLRMSAT